MAFKPMKVQVQEQIVNSFTPTDEQVNIKDIVLQGKNIKVIAGAGSGKSSTLRYIAQVIPEKIFLALCFNTANAKESNEHRDKPDNIVYSTGHSIAYRRLIDYTFKKKLQEWLDYRDLEYYDMYSLWGEEKVNQLTKAVLNCITWFCRSDKKMIQSFAETFFRNYTENPENDIILLNKEIRLLSDITKLYWEKLIDKQSAARITPDVYLKLYDLEKHLITEVYDPKTKSYIVPDVIFLDEAQDTNPVMVSIFARQVQQKGLVGDPMQQLYEWRGAGRAMDDFEDYKLGYLTESFRFNSEIAHYANTVLSKAGSSMQLIGSSKKNTIETKAHLCRTNAAVLSKISTFIGTNIKVYTSIDLKNTFSKLYHMQSCFFNEKPMYPCKELSNITDRVSLEKAVRFSEELSRLEKLGANIRKQGENLTSIKKKLEAIIVKNPSDADIVITTIHAAKGMEYDQVTIDEDFINQEEEETYEEMLERLWSTNSLCCLLYVAITRARVVAYVPEVLESTFEKEELKLLETIFKEEELL